MKHKIGLPNVMTALGLTLGLFVIFSLTLHTSEPMSYHELVSFLGLFIVAAILDAMDGALARAMDLESDFGGLFDSMSDVVTFGVAPSVFVLKTISTESGSIGSILLFVAAIAYSVAGVLRLVRFSTSYVPSEQKAVFTGLPIPAAAFAVTSLSLSLFNGVISKGIAEYVMIVALFFIAYLMISRWRFPSLKAINIKIHSFHFLAIIASLAALFFILFSKNLPIALMIGVWGYTLISWGIALYRLKRGQRTLAINDAADPEEDDVNK